MPLCDSKGVLTYRDTKYISLWSTSANVISLSLFHKELKDVVNYFDDRMIIIDSIIKIRTVWINLLYSNPEKNGRH